MSDETPRLGTPKWWENLVADPAKLAAEVAFVDVAQLERTLQRHSSLCAWVNATYEVAKVEEDKREWDKTKAEAVALLKAKEVLDPNTGKAKTVQVLEAEVVTDAEVQVAMTGLFAARDKLGALRAMSKALEARTDMLVQISAKQRLEESNQKRTQG